MTATASTAAACITLLIYLALAGCARPEPAASTAVARAPAGSLTVHDDAHPFLEFWSRAQREDDAARVARYRTEMVPRFAPFWDYVAADWGDHPDERLAKELRAFEPLEREFRAAADRLAPSLDEAIARLRRAFPDFDPSVDVRLVHSLGHMDGATRVFAGRYYLLFGVDQIARLHSWSDDRPFFTHELFHTYQDQRLGRDGRARDLPESSEEEHRALARPLYASLWSEGLATYVSEWLNPGASHASLLLDIPADLEASCRANLRFLAMDLASKLESTSPSDYDSYFVVRSHPPSDPRRPWRAGYVLGYLIAKKMHASTPMDALVALSGDALRDRLRAELSTLAQSAPGD